MKKAARTFLEIGAGEKPATHLMPRIAPGDKYVALDVRYAALGPRNKALVNLSKVKSFSIAADALSLPLRDGSVNHVVCSNVISDSWFPHVYTQKEFRGLSFRQVIEKLEAELHRVTKKGASITFHEYYTPSALELLEEYGKSRSQHIKEVFSRRWAFGREVHSKLSGYRGGVVIKLFKK